MFRASIIFLGARLCNLSGHAAIARASNKAKTTMVYSIDRGKTPAVLPLSIEYTIVVFALLLALAIAAWALSLHNRAPRKIMDALNIDALRTFGQDAAPHDTDALGVPALTMNIPNIESLPHSLSISAAHNIDATPSADAFTPVTGTNFPRHRIVLLPSISLPERAVLTESLAATRPGRRSTGLLSRYGEIQQE